MVTFTEPSDAELTEKVLDFLRLDQKEYKRLNDSGELPETIQEKVSSTKAHATTLIGQGVFSNQAWLWAIREKILERDAD